MRIFIPLLLLLVNAVAHAQETKSKIDSLSNEKDVEKFIHSFNKDYQEFRLKKMYEIDRFYGDKNFCKRVADSLKVDKNFYKADFDNNGRTDLLVIGYFYGFDIITIMDFGKDSLVFGRLTRRSFQDCVFPKIRSLNGVTIIDYYYQPDISGYSNGVEKKPIYLSKKSLIYKFGDFIEFNEKPVDHRIEKIDYKTTMCYGICPVFNLKIENDQKGQFNAIKFNGEQFNLSTEKTKEIKGIFNTEIDSVNFKQIFELLNYIDFPNLNDNYAVGWTDDQSCTLKITYDNGKVKEINDYGLIGTYGLDRLYQMLFDLRFNQNWKKSITN